MVNKMIEKQIKVLHLSDEEFDERINISCFSIGVRDVKISWKQEMRIEYMDEEELLQNINDLIGILNIQECKDFVFTYGERKFETPDNYNYLLLERLINSEEVTNLPITIVRYYYDEYLDNGMKIQATIGYDIDIISIDARLHNGAIINTPLCDVLLQTPINNNGDVEEHQILYNDYGIIIQSNEQFYTQKEFWEQSIGTDASDLFPL